MELLDNKCETEYYIDTSKLDLINPNIKCKVVNPNTQENTIKNIVKQYIKSTNKESR